MTWGKLESDIITNGKVGEAGPDGALLYIALLCLHTKRGANGVVPASCCRAERLRFEAVAFLGSFEPERIDRALDACVRAELCARRADGAIELRGWCDDHAPACSHCRKPNSEPSHKTCPACRDARKADRQPNNGKGARRTRAPRATGAQIGATGAQKAALYSDSDSDSDIPPTPREDARGARASAREGPAARGSGSEPEPNERDPVVELQRFLLSTTLRSKQKPFDRGRELMRVAEAAAATGLTATSAIQLWGLAITKSSHSDPGGLFETWLTENTWREVLDEQRMKASEVANRSRQPAGDPLDGVYGATP